MEEDECEVDEAVGEEEVKVDFVEELNVAAVRALSLKEETELLYREAMCLACQKNKRSIVTLPCCHFTLCRVCEPIIRKCPFRQCEEKIESAILTYEL